MTRIDEICALQQAKVGLPLGPTAWRLVTQDDIDAFGRATHDPDPMHVDPAWARDNSPFGQTIAFGFWTLSMLTAFMHELAGGQDGGVYEGVDHAELIGVNYGCDRLRFIEPVPVGARVRARGVVIDVKRTGADRLLQTTDLVVEVEGAERPALSTRWLSMLLLPSPTSELTGFRSEAKP